jgi:hypothetical protein
LLSPTWLTDEDDSLYKAGPPSLALLFTKVVSSSRARPDSPRLTAPPVVLARLLWNTTSRSSRVPMASIPPPRSAPLFQILVLPSTWMADPTSPRIAPPVLCSKKLVLTLPSSVQLVTRTAPPVSTTTAVLCDPRIVIPCTWNRCCLGTIKCVWGQSMTHSPSPDVR